jgi:hypothetical protein
LLSALQRTHELVRFEATTQTIAGHLVRFLRGIGRVRAYPSMWSVGLRLTLTDLTHLHGAQPRLSNIVA